MARMRRVSILAAVPALAAWCVSMVGCSCEDSQPPARRVVREAPAPQDTPAPQQTSAPQPPGPADGGTVTRRQPGDSLIHAPADYIRTTTITVPRYAKSKIESVEVQNMINQFKALEGRYPLSLKELEQWGGESLRQPPSGYTYKYDSNTGKVEVVQIPR